MINQITLTSIVIISIVGCATENSSISTSSSRLLSNKNFQNVLKQPYTNISVESDQISVDAEKDSIYNFSNGCFVHVPANAFIHLDGKPVMGDVDLSFTLYSSLGEILLSGIPMKYDSAGTVYDFTSAGMYAISGQQNNKEVMIDPNKSLEVGVASSIEDSPCFNFYELNENGNWDYLSTEEAILNPNVSSDLLIPEKPELIHEDDLVFDINIQKISNQVIPSFEISLWKYDGNREDTVDKEMLSNINYKNLILEKSSNSLWSYNLQLKNNNSWVTIPVKPAFTVDNIEKAMKKYQEELDLYQANEQARQAVKEGNYLRVSKIQNFGIYNYDRVIKDASRTIVSASFDIGKDYSTDFISVYLICKEDNFVIRYETYSFNKFSYNPFENNILIATLPNHELAYIDAKSFKEQISNSDGVNINFKLNVLDKLVTSSKNLEAFIDSL